MARNRLFDVALIPWLPTSHDCVRAKDSAFYSRFIANGGSSNVTKNRLKVFETFARAFPFYLAGRYHQMDGAKLQRCCEKDGLYWKNAGNYLRVITDCATIPYHNLMLGEPFTQDIKGGSEVCESAAEFLLEPWVVIQLPFQPALLHQWTVAAWAESLRFDKRLIEIGTRGFAAHLKDVFSDLASLNWALKFFCVALLSSFYNSWCRVPEASSTCDSLITQLASALARLEFILSDDCSSLLNYIKQQSWRLAPDELKICSRMEKLSGDIEQFIPILSDFFWRNPRKITQFIELTVLDENSLSDVYEKAVSRFMLTRPRMNNPQERRETILHFGKKHVFEDGQIKGMKRKQEFLDNFKKHLGPEGTTTLEKHALSYWSSKAIDSSAPKFHEGGVLQQILSLQADIRAEQAMGAMTRLIWIAAEKFDNGVYLDPGDMPAVTESLVESCKEKLAKMSAAEAKWTFVAILHKCIAKIEEQTVKDPELSLSAVGENKGMLGLLANHPG